MRIAVDEFRRWIIADSKDSGLLNFYKYHFLATKIAEELEKLFEIENLHREIFQYGGDRVKIITAFSLALSEFIIENKRTKVKLDSLKELIALEKIIKLLSLEFDRTTNEITGI